MINIQGKYLVQKSKNYLIDLIFIKSKLFLICFKNNCAMFWKNWSIILIFFFALWINLRKFNYIIWSEVKVSNFFFFKSSFKSVVNVCWRDINNKFSFKFCPINHYSKFYDIPLYQTPKSFQYINIAPKFKI